MAIVSNAIHVFRYVMMYYVIRQFKVDECLKVGGGGVLYGPREWPLQKDYAHGSRSANDDRNSTSPKGGSEKEDLNNE